jgi:uncharacterized delta-60 repeat protein/uncharacterized repeat protein (TIGR02543 family)
MLDDTYMEKNGGTRYMNIRPIKFITVVQFLVGLFAMLAAMGTLNPAVAAVDTILDPGFNAASAHPGVTYFANPQGVLTDKTAGNAVAVYPLSDITNGGKIVTVGTYDTGIVFNGIKVTEIIVRRYNTDGTFDKEFRYFDNNMVDPYAGNAVAIQPDGKIVVVGTVNIGGATKLCVLRLVDAAPVPPSTISQISLDPNFGTQYRQGVFVYPDENAFNYKGNAVALQADGKIVVAGSVNMGGNDHAWVARFLADGSNIDPGFVTQGDIGYTFGVANAVAVQADQKIVVVGTYNDNFIDYTNPANPVTVFTGNSYAWVIRLTSTGAEDHCGFNNSSIDPLNCTGGDFLLGGTVPGVYTGNALAIDPVSQKIVVAGTSFGSKARVFQLTTSGILDPVFNPDQVDPAITGIVDLQGLIATFGNAVAIQSDGKIVLAGTNYNDISGANSSVFLARMNNNGALANSTLLDTNFNFGSYDFMFGATGRFAGRALAIQSDDKIVVAGTGDASQFFAGSTSLLTMRLQKTTHRLTVNNVGGGTVGVSLGTLTNGISYYLPGESVQLTATPDPGYYFAGWSGDCTGTSTTCTLIMNADKNVTVRFALYRLDVTVIGNGHVVSLPGTIDCNRATGICTDFFTYGTAVKLTVYIPWNVRLISWEGACTGNPVTTLPTLPVGTYYSECTVIMTQDLTVSITTQDKNHAREVDDFNNESIHSSITAAYNAAFNAGRTHIYLELVQGESYWEYVLFDKGLLVDLLGSYGSAFEAPSGGAPSTIRGVLAIRPWLNPATGLLTPGRINVKNIRIRPQ